MPPGSLPPERLAGFLGALLVGYVVIESTCENHQLWNSREDFLTDLVNLLLPQAKADLGPQASSPDPDATASAVEDLPEPWVHQILQQAKDSSLQDYALAYVFVWGRVRTRRGKALAEIAPSQRQDSTHVAGGWAAGPAEPVDCWQTLWVLHQQSSDEMA